MLALRPYQESIKLAARQSFASGNKAVLIQLATGGGKTVIFADIMGGMARNNKTCMLLVHRVELLNQASRALFKMGIDHSYIASGVKMKKSNVYVASVGTLVSRIRKGIEIPTPDLLITDEAHHATAGQWRMVSTYFNTKHLGVTATPIRTDGKGLDEIFQDMISGEDHGASMADLIEAGYLSRYQAFSHPKARDFQEVRMKGADYDPKELEEQLKGIMGSEVIEYSKHSPGRPAIAFYPTVAMAEMGAEKFRDAGYNFISVDGSMSSTDRKDAINGLASGKYQGLTNCSIISEGTDIPVVDTIIDMQKTKSLSLYLQKMGRGLRTHPDKTHATLIDMVGNIGLHGLPCDRREWSLEGIKRRKKKKETEVRITQCDQCSNHFETKQRQCPKCGWKIPPGEPREEVVLNGELVSVSPEFFAVHDRAVKEQKKKEQREATTEEQLIELGRSRGYRNPEGWAYNIMKSRRNKRWG